MKTATRLFTLSVLMLCVGLMADANAQSRGRGNGRDRHDNGHHNEHRDNRHHDSHHHDHHDYARVQHVYHHNHRDVYYRPAPPPVIVHHYARPRYVYYRDYDVYYDCQRSVYISYSGRNWSVSAALPVRLSRVDIHRATRVSVEYYNDDFPTYLDHGTPVYGAVYTD